MISFRKNHLKISLKTVCSKSTFNQVLNAYCLVQELFNDVRQAQSKVKFLIESALKLSSDSSDRRLALTKINEIFQSLGPLAKRQANNELVKVVDRMMTKLLKDKNLLLESMVGMDGDVIREWTNQRSMFLISLLVLIPF